MNEEAMSKNEKAMSKALDTIYEVAEGLKIHEVPVDVSGGLDLIMSIARHKHDVRSAEEIKANQTD